MMWGGFLVNVVFIEASSSTKKAERTRNPEAYQTRKSNNWDFDYKAHASVDAGSGLVHSVVRTPANVSEVTVACRFVREDDRFCCVDLRLHGHREKRGDCLRRSPLDDELEGRALLPHRQEVVWLGKDKAQRDCQETLSDIYGIRLRQPGYVCEDRPKAGYRMRSVCRGQVPLIWLSLWGNEKTTSVLSAPCTTFRRYKRNNAQKNLMRNVGLISASLDEIIPLALAGTNKDGLSRYSWEESAKKAHDALKRWYLS